MRPEKGGWRTSPAHCGSFPTQGGAAVRDEGVSVGPVNKNLGINQ